MGSCKGCGAPDDQGCQRGCPSIVQLRAHCNPGEHPLIGRMVMLRVEMNAEFGSRFSTSGWDHKLALLEQDISKALETK